MKLDPDVRILLDCRWLNMGGPGRATELLLRGLCEQPPPGRWILWGQPEKLEAYAWDRSTISPTKVSPLAMSGQREALNIPSNDLAVYPHQIRPLRPGRSITLIHDTIPLHFGPKSARAAKWLAFAAAARLSTKILTVSEYSKRTICRDLRIKPAKISIIHYPVDPEFVKRVKAGRGRLEPRRVALYVGRFGRHKNLSRLVEGFKRSEFGRSGGKLMLVGGSAAEIAGLLTAFRPSELEQVEISGYRPQAELEDLYATAKMLVLPSLEEGFGLPAWEAMSVRLPVCISDRGALPEIAGDRGFVFDPFSVEAIAAALDLADSAAPPGELAGGSLFEFAGQVLDSIEAAGA